MKAHLRNGSAEKIPLCWGKYNKETGFLSLTAHCLDVALVFRELCELKGIRRTLEIASNELLNDQQLDRLSVLAMLHDVGKANRGFQQKILDSRMPQAGHIRELAPILDFEALDEELHQSFIKTLPEGIETWFADEKSAYSYLLAIFSHHGRPVRFRGQISGTYSLARKEWWRPKGSFDPMDEIADISKWAKVVFPEAFNPGSSLLPSEPRFHHRFAGLVILADWLGSHPYWFPLGKVDLADRIKYDKEIVPTLLGTVGLDSRPLYSAFSHVPKTFKEKFGFSPYPLQAIIDDLDPADENNRLLILESETGSGKTEGALNWFYKIFTNGKVDSLYFALPTRVAARELYSRIQKTIEEWFPNPQNRPVTVLAVPGYAMVDNLPPTHYLIEEEKGSRWQDDESLRRRERQWSAEHPKRFLAATIAVGTIDQALLSTIQTAHVHLRSVCLDRSLLVVDEVHASDFYMSTLLESLLSHHLEIGGRAILLSATLGICACHRYINLTGKNDTLPTLSNAQKVLYPSITFANGKTRSILSPEKKKTVFFEIISQAFQPEAIAKHIVVALEAGARVLVVMNTVSRAIALLRNLEAVPDIHPEWFFQCEGRICPHHGRFAPEDRSLLDARVSERLGKESLPGPILLVGTQTLEQSLDIDADLIISDLAPTDVLLQRVGRLHRHSRRRPLGYETPRCFVLTPEHSLKFALDSKGHVSRDYKHLGYGSVYEDLRTLELTRLILTKQPEVVIPRNNRFLVEAVTHPESLASLEDECWLRHGREIEGGELAQAIAASNVAAIFDKHFGEFEFNESGGKVATRLGTDTLRYSLEHPIISPFGQTISAIFIPAHMGPDQAQETVTVEKEGDGAVVLRCGDRYYHYTRYGLEVER